MKKRIWELDFARGAALLGMMIIHLVYDLVDLFGVLNWQLPQWYLVFKNNFGAVFLVISGISVTLGSRCVRRGLTVFGCGFLCTGATLLLYLTGMADRSILIYFGVLHCLGVCMLLWPLFRQLPNWMLVPTGLAFAAVGLVLRRYSPDVPAVLIPLGFAPGWFSSSDYFPLLPNLGYFLLGAALGRLLYREPVTRFPKVEEGKMPIRLFCAMGRHSLPIYLLHQPILAALVLLLQRIL